VRQFEKQKTLELDDLIQIFRKHWRDESWHEVLRLMAGMLDARFTGKTLEYLIGENGEAEKFSNRFLSAKCLDEVRNRNTIDGIASQLRDRVKELTKYGNITRSTHPESDNLVFQIRRQAVAAVAATWKDDPETLPWLKQLARTYEGSSVREAAVQEIARGWKDDPETLPILKQRAQSDYDSDVRRAAVQELAQGWKDDPKTLPWLKQLAQSDDDANVREAAVQELVRGWKDDPETLPIFKQLAQSDDDRNVREAAVQELARGWKDDPETLPILKQRAQSDDNWYVRLAAAQKLVSGWKDQPGIFEILCDVAIKDPFKREKDWQYNPRQAALAAIIELYPYRPETLELVRDRAQNDPDQELREFALEKLAELERQ
jgi:HEAT repeat protein